MPSGMFLKRKSSNLTGNHHLLCLYHHMLNLENHKKFRIVAHPLVVKTKRTEKLKIKNAFDRMVTFFPWCSIKKTFCSVVCFNNVVLEQRFSKRCSNVLFCVLCVRLCAVFSEQSIRLTRAVFFKVRSDSVTLWCIFITEYRALSCIPEKSRTRYFQKKIQISQHVSRCYFKINSELS